jgi:hypothetical protein
MAAIDLFSAFAVDTALEQEGTKTELPGAGDTKFTVAREGNKAYSKLIQKLVKQNRAVLDSKGDASEQKSDEILVEVLAKTVLLGWEGEVLYKGKPMAYSLENAKLLLANKEFRAVVQKVSSDLENFKQVKDLDDEKN